MDSTGKEKPWDNITLFTCNDISIFELDSKNIEHIKSEEELVLHKYRNRINNYEKILPSLKNWEYYKKVVNPYELIYTQKKYDNFPKSIYRLKPLSRSYFKMVDFLEV